MNRKPIFSSLSLLLSMILPTTVMASEVSSGKDLNLSDSPSNMKSGGVNQQSKKVTGTVVDAAGMPIIGANIVVAGTTNGTITDFDGNFVLDGVDANSVLVVSYIGYTNFEVKVGTQDKFSITLKEDSQALEEVVVVGYGTQKKANMTGSVAQVDSKVLESRPIQNLSSGIQGLMPGVTVTAGQGRPGQDGATIRIRGVGTLNTADPYILVDGIETSTMNEVDPNDIESISVLKDAASAAIMDQKLPMV